MAFFREHFILTRRIGATKSNTCHLEGALGLIHTRQSYLPTGTHPSPGSVSVWKSTKRSTSLSLTSRPTLCTHWSLMGNTAQLHWVETRGKHSLARKHLYSSTATRKGLTQWPNLRDQKLDLASWEITNPIVAALIPGSVLVWREALMTLTHVEMKLDHGSQITGAKKLKPWDIF